MAGTFTDGKEGTTLGYAAHDASGVLSPFRFTRQAVGATDVAFDIKFCGICHSDLHQVRRGVARAGARVPVGGDAPRQLHTQPTRGRGARCAARR
jgi:hypothetical protein